MTKATPPKNHPSDKEPSLAAPKLFLLDVEGTVAPISLIYDQMFPYARAHFERFLQLHC